MEMAVAPLRRFQPESRASDFNMAWPQRGCILAGTALLTLAGCYEMYEVLQVGA